MASNNLVDIIINARDNASKDIDRVSKSLDSLGKQGTKIAGALAGVSGSIAGMAPAVAGVGALASSFASAGVGAVAFGAVATGALNDVFEATDKTFQNLSDEGQKAYKDLQSFKTWWSGFTTEFEKPVFKVFGEGMKLVQNTMNALKPAIESVGNVLGGFMEKLNGSFKTDQVKSFFDYFNTTAGANLQAILTSAGNMFVGFMEILKAFAPLSEDMNGGLVKMTESFRKWAESLANSKGFQDFIEYAKENAPKVINTIKNIAGFVGDVVEALAPMGSAVLDMAQSFSEWLNNSPAVEDSLNKIKDAGQWVKDNLEEVKTTVVALGVAFVAFKATMAIVSTVQTAISIFRTLKTVIQTVRTAQIGLNLAMMANPVGLVVAAVIALIAIGILLWQNWDVIKAKALELWAKMKEMWDKIKAKIGEAVTNIIAKATEMKDKMIEKVKELASKAWNAIKTGVGNIITAIANWVSDMVAKAVELRNKFRDKVKEVMSKALDAVTDGVSDIISGIKDWFTDMVDSGKGLLEAFTKGITKGFKSAKDAVEKGMEKIRQFLPFSPAKKGALSDLDKSGASFFPTFAGGMMKSLPSMLKMAERGMSELHETLQAPAKANIGLERFSGGRNSMVVTHEIVGTVSVEGNGGKESILVAKKEIATTVVENDLFKGLRQSIRKR
ncbi:hypothetical protein [Metabacillus bambusae]|uniref:Phage tail tape measure protein n=1 Tax=Metabacillus bambusae TaxID=2795218 RepID=A0ABS3N019_9BACI|nr:hypothetical protein [Metabacillus bambusae]MBO1511543.1 hypothetical protein [Metabacillus bambusae]